MKRLKQAIAEMCEKKCPFALVSIKEGSGSMPRHTGAAMLVRADGSIEGSVGGGVLEARAILRAQQAIAEQKSAEMPFDLSSADAANSDMICGGTGVLSVRYCSAAERELLEMELAAAQDGQLVVFGGGHIAKQLARIAELLDIPVTIMEDRQEFCSPERFPDASRIVLQSYDEIPVLPLTARDMVVIVTRGHLGDGQALRWALQTKAGYIGMIGSKRKRDLMYQQLVGEGIAGDALQRVHAPIGLPIGAQTPEEIAVSIAAEIIAFRHKSI